MPDLFETTDAPDSTATTLTLRPGQTLQGNIQTATDRDYYRVDLVAGQNYSFALVGTGAGSTLDPQLRLFGPDGVSQVAGSTDDLANGNSYFQHMAATTGTYFLVAESQGLLHSGQYGLSVATGSRATVDVQMGAGILDMSAPYAWNAAPATAANVSIGFRQTDNRVRAFFSRFTAAEMAAVQAVARNISDVCGLSFDFVNPGGYTDNASILLSNYAVPDGTGGFAFAPDPAQTAGNAQAGDIYLNLSGGIDPDVLPPGSFSYFELLQELGHAVGLSHADALPGSGEPPTANSYAGNARFIQETHQYSVMSHYDEAFTTDSWASNPDGLMLFDIYGLQQIYGVNTTTRTGDTIYGFNSNAGGIFDFATNPDPAFCIWDAGGVDTINASGFSSAQKISLVAGSFSNIGGLKGNVSIALGATIERATGGTGDDRFDLQDGNIDNTIDGNGGVDTSYVTYSFGAGYTVEHRGTAANFTMQGSAGTDMFRNIEFIHFAGGVTVSTASILPTPWIFHDPTFELAAFAPEAGGWSNNTIYPRQIADINGDGLADIVGFGSAGVVVALATGAGHFGGTTFELATFGADASGGGWWNTDAYPRRLADINGDGRADIVGFGSAGVYVSLATGNGHFGGMTFELAAFGSEAGGWNSNRTYLRELADVNGDGMADILGFGSAGVYVSLATGGGHFGAVAFELAAFGADAGGWLNNDVYLRDLADLNGDGMADIVGFGSAGVYVSLATGGGHFGAVSFELAAFGADAGGWNNETLFPRRLADVNGDGMADIIGFGSAGVAISLATGHGHFGGVTADIDGYGASAGGWVSQAIFPRELGDVNGDGRADIIGFASAGVQVSLA